MQLQPPKVTNHKEHQMKWHRGRGLAMAMVEKEVERKERGMNSDARR
jgi:predicted GNAT family acetyltransferase